MKTPLVTDLSPDSELFEQERFDALVSELGSITKAFRETMGHADKILNQRFLELSNVKLLIRRRAWLMDKLLLQLWHNKLVC